MYWDIIYVLVVYDYLVSEILAVPHKSIPAVAKLIQIQAIQKRYRLCFLARKKRFPNDLEHEETLEEFGHFWVSSVADLVLFASYAGLGQSLELS